MKKVTEEEIYNGWLKYHGLTVDELIKQDPETIKTPEWYKKYAVTQTQHDEWYEWAIDLICKRMKCSRKLAMRSFAFDYLNLAPSVK